MRFAVYKFFTLQKSIPPIVLRLFALTPLATRLATGWTARGSNPGEEEIFRTHSDRPWGPPVLLYNGYRVFPGGKAAGAWL